MIKLTALAALLAFGAMAQDQQPDRKMVEVKYLKGPRLEEAVRLLQNFMNPGDARAYPELNSVIFRGSPPNVAAGEAILRKFDVPSTGPDRPKMQPTYVLRIYMVQATAGEGEGGPLPAEIAPAVDQMKKSFLYKSYRLLDTVLVQSQPSREGISASGLIADPKIVEGTYSVGIRELAPMDEGKAIHLRGFNFQVRRPTRMVGDKMSYAEATIQTELTARIGQKLVVGKLTASQADTPIFLIITAETI